MSLSTTKKQFAAVLHELADEAYFGRTTLVASAHNMSVESYPWRFSSVISVGSHEDPDPLVYYCEPEPAGRVLCQGRRRRGRVVGRPDRDLHRQQLCDAAHQRRLRFDPGRTPRADPVRAEDRAAPHRHERQERPLSELNAAVAAGVVGSEERYRRLLASIVEVARSIFQARASSILLYEEETEELVFAAVVGEGEEELHGLRFPAGTGIAGWVLTTQTPLVIEDVQKDPRFARNVAEGTGYVPKGLMAVPLLEEERVLGVLEVLDRPQNSRFSLAEMNLLELFAAQAAVAVDLLQRARRAESLLAGEGELSAVGRLAQTLDALGDDARPAALRLIEALDETLRRAHRASARPRQVPEPLRRSSPRPRPPSRHAR